MPRGVSLSLLGSNFSGLSRMSPGFFSTMEAGGKLAGTTKHAGNFFVLLPAATQTAGQGIRFGERLPWQTIVKGAQ